MWLFRREPVIARKQQDPAQRIVEGNIINNQPAAPADCGYETGYEAGVIFPDGNIEEGKKDEICVEGVFRGRTGGERFVTHIHQPARKSEVHVLRKELP